MFVISIKRTACQEGGDYQGKILGTNSVALFEIIRES